MKQWEIVAVSGLFSLAIGVVLMMWGFQALEPIDLEITLPTVKATLDTTFIALFMLGMFLIGSGVSELLCSILVRKFEKQLPPPQ